nr:hypothetical protein 9 [Alphaproteobacteria bacterium]
MIAHKICTLAALGLLSISLAACGSSKTDRALSGGGIGAGIGAAGAAVTGGSVATGAVVGGAAGAVAGAITDEGDIDLDD